MFRHNRNSEQQVILHDNAYRADIITGHDQQIIETVFRPHYSPEPHSPLGWRMSVPRSATVINHSVQKGAEVVKGTLADRHIYVDDRGKRHIKEINPEVAHVTAQCLDPLYVAQKSLRQLFAEDEFKLIWSQDLDPLQQQLADEINSQPLRRSESLTPDEERQVSYMLAAEKAHQLLDYFSAPTFVHQAIAVAGGLHRVSEGVITGIQNDIDQSYIQRRIQEGIKFATLN